MSNELWVLVDEESTGPSGELTLYAGRKRISAERLGELIEEFTSNLGSALSKAKSAAAGYELDEVTVNASLNGDLGFVLVAKIGTEAGISLTFRKVK